MSLHDVHLAAEAVAAFDARKGQAENIFLSSFLAAKGIDEETGQPIDAIPTALSGGPVVPTSRQQQRRRRRRPRTSSGSGRAREATSSTRRRRRRREERPRVSPRPFEDEDDALGTGSGGHGWSDGSNATATTDQSVDENAAPPRRLRGSRTASRGGGRAAAEEPALPVYDVDFVDQCFTGCVRYRKLISAVVEAFFSVHRAESSLTDIPVLSVYTYLAVVRLAEVSFGALRSLWLRENPLVMLNFVSFVFSADVLHNTLKDEWCKHYDEGFVDETLIATLLDARDEADDLVAALRAKVHGREEKVIPRRPSTVPAPFNLTQPRLKPIPEPELISVEFKARPIPDTTYAGDVTTKRRLQSAKAANHKRAQELARQASEPKFRTTERTRRVETAVMRRMDEETEYKTWVHPVPSFDAEIPVKLNAATILRDEQILRKQQEKDAALLRAYEEGQHDAYEFHAWQERMREADEDARLAEIERRRLDIRLTHEEVIRQKAVTVETKKSEVEAVKARKAALGRERARRRRLADRANKDKVESVQKARDAAVDKRRQIRVKNRKIARRVSAETAALKRQAEAREKREHQRKQKLIQEIRALERVRKKPHTKTVDPTVSSGTGTFSEMSLAELRERLAAAKARDAAEREEKRLEIVQAKQAKADALQKKLERLGRVRAKRTSAGNAQREARAAARERAAERQAKIREEKLLEFADRVSGVRAENEARRRAMEAERARVAQRNHFLQASKEQMERQRFRELEKAQERFVLTRQQDRKTRAEEEGALRAKEARKRTAYLEGERARTLAAIQASDRNFRDRARSAKQRQAEELNANRKKIVEERERYQRLVAGEAAGGGEAGEARAEEASAPSTARSTGSTGSRRRRKRIKKSSSRRYLADSGRSESRHSSEAGGDESLVRSGGSATATSHATGGLSAAASAVLSPDSLEMTATA